MSQTKGPNTTVPPKAVLSKYKVIAVIGASKNPEKDAFTVPQYMKEHGYKIIPINPTADQVVGEKAYPSLSDLPPELASQVDIVDVFRPSEELPQVAQQVIAMKERYGRPFVFWAQIGLEDEEAKRLLSEKGLKYVMNDCVRAAHRRHSL